MLMRLAMFYPLTTLDVIELVPRILQVGIAVMFVRSRWYRKFPFFFAYTLCELIQLSILFPLYHLRDHGYPLFFYLHWFFTACSVGLRFAVIYEVFQQLVKWYEGFALMGRKLMQSSLLVLLLLSIVAAAYAPRSDTNLLLHQLVVIRMCLNGVQCGLVLVLFMAAAYFQMTWPHRVFGIVLGLELYLSVELAMTALRPQLGMRINGMFDYVEVLGYVCAILVWSYYLFVPERVRAGADVVPAADLEKWNEELLRLLQR
jgi:hypothetical protein